MKKPLLDVMFASEKRKKVLLLLQDGPKEMQFILKSLNTTRQNLLPQMSILKEHHLITHEKDVCELTIIGKEILDKIAPALNTVKVFEDNIDYWGSHTIDFIPKEFLRRIAELGSCNLVELQIQETFEEDRSFIEEAKKSKFLFVITSFIFPNYNDVLSELIAAGAEISIIVSSGVYEKLLQENPRDLQHFVSNTQVKIYKYPDSFAFLSFSLTDHSVMFRLLTLEGNYDNKRMLCSSPQALEWGKDFFYSYMKKSVLIDKI